MTLSPRGSSYVSGHFLRRWYNLAHMAPENAESQIENLFVSVNENAVSDHKTLLAAYKNLDDILTLRNVERPIVLIADGPWVSL